MIVTTGEILGFRPAVISVKLTCTPKSVLTFVIWGFTVMEPTTGATVSIIKVPALLFGAIVLL